MKSLILSVNSLSDVLDTSTIKSPIRLDSYDVLKNQPSILLKLMSALMSSLLSDAVMSVANKFEDGKSSFETKNDTQFFMARTISLVFIKASVLDRFLKYMEDPVWRSEERALMAKLALLYGLWCLEEHTSSLLRCESKIVLIKSLILNNLYIYSLCTSNLKYRIKFLCIVYL